MSVVESSFAIIAEPNRRAILSLLLPSERSVGEIERELRLRSDSGFPSASDTLRSVLSWKNLYDWLFPRIYARRNIALKSYMTILHCLANEIYLQLLG